MSSFELNVPSIEILETTLQYKLFMYEIFFILLFEPKLLSLYIVYTLYLSVVTCVPPPNFYTWRTPCQSPSILRSVASSICVEQRATIRVQLQQLACRECLQWCNITCSLLHVCYIYMRLYHWGFMRLNYNEILLT